MYFKGLLVLALFLVPLASSAILESKSELIASFDEKGFVLSPSNEYWKVSFSSITEPDRLTSWETLTETKEYSRYLGFGAKEFLEVLPQMGFEHSFLLEDSTPAPYSLFIVVSYSNNIQVVSNEEGIRFFVDDSVVLQYDNLVVFAANKVQLDSEMKWQSVDSDHGIIEITVKEDGQFPILVDPFASTPTMIIPSSARYGMRFGMSVAAITDRKRADSSSAPDGFLIGAPGYNSGRGRAYVYHFSGGSVSEVQTLDKTDAGRLFASNVEGIGDVNGDGIGDVAINHPGNNYVYIYYGKEFSSSGTPQTMTSSTAVRPDYYDAVGRVIAFGDVQGKKVNDLAINGPVSRSSSNGGFAVWQTSAGFAWNHWADIYNDCCEEHSGGGCSVESINNCVRGISSSCATYWTQTCANYAISNCGGCPDKVSGNQLFAGNYIRVDTQRYLREMYCTLSCENCGASAVDVSFVVYESSSSSGPYTRTYRGTSTLHAGDLTVNHRPDTGVRLLQNYYYIVGCAWTDARLTYRNQKYQDTYIDIYGSDAYFYGSVVNTFGSSSIPSEIPGPSTSSSCTTCLFNDHAVLMGMGIYSSDTGAGAVVNYPTTYKWYQTGGSTYQYYGLGLAFANVNGDMSADLLYSRPGYSLYGTASDRYGNFKNGFVGLKMGPFTSSNDVWTYSPKDKKFLGSNFGYTIANAGDVNGDGFQDVLVSAPFTQYGSVLLFMGQSSYPYLGKTPALILDGIHEHSEFGIEMIGDFDFNQDGYKDVAIGAPWHGEHNEGAVFIFYGHKEAPYLSNTYDVMIPGYNTVHWSGFGAAISAGDFDGDGTSDLLIGAHHFNSDNFTAQSTSWKNSLGAAFIYWGVPHSDLTIESVTLDTSSVTASQNIVMNIKIRNNGPFTCPDPSIKLPFEKATLFPAGFSSSSCTYVASTGVCARSTPLPPESSFTFTVSAKVGGGVRGSRSVILEVTSSQKDEDESNNAATVTFNVVGDDSISISQQVDTTDRTGVSFVYSGERLTWAVVVSNNGPSDALDVVLQDTIPALATLVTDPTSSLCTVSGGSFTCNLGTIKAGKDSRIPFSLTTASSLTGSSITLSNSIAVTSTDTTTPVRSIESVSVRQNAEMSLTIRSSTETTSSHAVTAGNVVTYTLMALNSGPSMVTSATMTFAPDSHLSLASLSNAAADGGSCSLSGSNVVCNWTGLTVDTNSLVTARIRLSLSTDCPSGTTLSSSVSYTWIPNVAATTSTATVTDMTIVSSDLSILLSATSPFQNIAYGGQQLTYTALVTNLGPSRSGPYGLQLALPIPSEGVTVNSGASSIPSECTLTSSNALTCSSLTALSYGNTASVVVVMDVAESISTSTSLVADASISSSDDAISSNDQSSVTTTVSQDCNAAVYSNLSPADVHSGETLSYALQVRNFGPAVARNLAVTVRLPTTTAANAGTFTIPAGWTNTGTADAPVLTLTVSRLASGSALSYSLPYTVSTNMDSGTLSFDAIVANSHEASGGDDNNEASESVNVSPASSLSLSLSTSPPQSHNDVVIGDTITYVVLVANAGPSAARTVSLTSGSSFADAGLTSLTLASTTASCTGTTDFSCTIDTIPPGSSFTLEMEATVPTSATSGTMTVTMETSSPDDTSSAMDNSASVSHVLTNEADLSVQLKSFPSTNVEPSTPTVPAYIYYYMIVMNNGPAGAKEASATFTYPTTDLTFSSENSDSTFCSDVSGTITCTPTGGAIDSNDALSYKLTFVVPQGTASWQVDAAVASTHDPKSSNNAASLTLATSTGSDIQVVSFTAEIADSSSSSTSTLLAGNLVTFKSLVTNNGPQQAKDCHVYITIPAGVYLSAHSAENTNGDCSVDGNGNLNADCQLTWHPDNMNVGQSVAMYAVVQIPTDMAEATSLSFVSSVDSSSADIDFTDSDLGNNQITIGTVTAVGTDLGVSLAASTTSLSAGQTILLSASVVNYGPSLSSSSQLEITYPSTFSISSTLSGIVSESAGSVILAIGTIEDNAQNTITIRFAIPSDATAGDYSITGTITPGDSDTNAANDESVLAVQVDAIADLSVALQAGASVLNYGDTIIYTIVLANSGPSDATGVVLSADAASPLVGQFTKSWTIGPLPAGVVVTKTFTAALAWDASSSSIVQTTATVTSTTADSDTADRTARLTTSTGQAADVDATLSLTPAANDVYAGNSQKISVLIASNGPSRASTVMFDVTVPVSATATSIPAGCVLKDSTIPNVFQCSAGSLSPGTSSAHVFTISLDPNTVLTDTFVEVVASSSTPDPKITNNQARQTFDLPRKTELSLVSSANKETMRAGNTVFVSYVLSNAGPSTAEDVSFTVSTDAYNTFIGSSASCKVSGDDLLCELGNIEPRSSVNLYFTAKVDPEDTTLTSTSFAHSVSDSAASDIITGSVSVNLEFLGAISLGMTSAENVTAGNTLLYNIFIYNSGPSKANDIVLTFNLDSELDYKKVVFPDEDCSLNAPSNVVTCNLPVLDAGSSFSPVLYAAVPGSTMAATVTSTASVTTASMPAGTFPAPKSTTADVLRSADTSVFIKPTPTTLVAVDDTFALTVSITNAGPSVARDVDFTVNLDSLVTSTAPSGCTASLANAMDCTFAAIDVATTSTITFDVAVPADIPDTTNLTFTSVITDQSTPDPRSGNNEKNVTVDVDGSADVSVAIGGPSAATASESLYFSSSVYNLGPAVATNVVLIKNVSSNFVIDAEYLASTTGCSVADNIITCVIGTMAVNEQQTVRVRVTVDPEAEVNQVLTVVSSAAGAKRDLVATNDKATYKMTVYERADMVLFMNKIPNTETRVGGSLQFGLQINNNGPSMATNPMITFTYPAVLGANPFNQMTMFTAGTSVLSGDTRQLAFYMTRTPLPMGKNEFSPSLAIPLSYEEITLTLSAVVGADTDDRNTANNVATISDSILGSLSNVSLVLSFDREEIASGGRGTVSALVITAGPSTTSNAVLTLTIPEEVELDLEKGVQYVGFSTQQKSLSSFAWDATTRTLVIKMEFTLSINANYLPSFDILVPNPHDSFTNATISGSVTHTIADGSTADNSDTLLISSYAKADMDLELDIDTVEVNAMQELEYSVILMNNGPTTAADVKLDIFLSSSSGIGNLTVESLEISNLYWTGVNVSYVVDNGLTHDCTSDSAFAKHNATSYLWSCVFPLMPADSSVDYEYSSLDVALMLNDTKTRRISMTLQVSSFTPDRSLSNNLISQDVVLYVNSTGTTYIEEEEKNNALNIGLAIGGGVLGAILVAAAARKGMFKAKMPPEHYHTDGLENEEMAEKQMDDDLTEADFTDAGDDGAWVGMDETAAETGEL